MRSTSTWLVVRTLVLALAGTTSVWAQNVGTVRGRVTGPTGEKKLDYYEIAVRQFSQRDRAVRRDVSADASGRSLRVACPSARLRRAHRLGHRDGGRSDDEGFSCRASRDEPRECRDSRHARRGAHRDLSAGSDRCTLRRGFAADRANRDGANDSSHRPIVQLSARDDRRRHRPHSTRDVARSRA